MYNSETNQRSSLALAKTRAPVDKSTKRSHDTQIDNLPSSEIKESNMDNAKSNEDDDVVWVEKEVKTTTASKRCKKPSRSKSPNRKKSYHSGSR